MRRLQVAAFAGMFLFGVAAALLGATLPLLSERLEIGLGRVGTLFLVMNACMLASSFALGALQDRFGMKPPLVVGPLVVGAALLVVAGAETYAHLLLAVALLGVGGTALNGASNALVSDLHEDLAAKSAALNRVGLFFGFGALFIPFAIGVLLRTAGLRAILTAGAALCALVAVANALPAYPPAKQAGGLSLAEAARLARDPLVLLLGLLLFFQSGNEFIVGGFTTTLLTSDVGMSVGASSYALAG
ncbi:MAG TPA: MFS transporter, partial [Vicinamibacteria bacterium]